jgi:hypothetical protein
MERVLINFAQEFPNYTFFEKNDKIYVKVKELDFGEANPDMSKDIHNNILRLMSHFTRFV